ncbi:MAG TPA: hypothetical protein PK573_00060 [Spirochaetota bacterium]|nr:hypothetical protein [Spirochaetota bacterium]HRZ26751.1 hypothetical protein [Spirochaetota bacterium]HSA15051.1 hypothetical protein [Spirochaetota bacterium]
MKHFLVIPIMLLLAGAACSGGKIKSGDPGFRHFKIAFEQDGVIRDAENNVVKLRKKPFTVIVSFAESDGLFVSASLKADSYLAAINGEKLEDIAGFSGPGLEEELFNKDETLALSATIPNYWNYTSDSDHRFSEIIVKPDVLLCRRNVSRLNLVDYRKKTDLVDLKETEIYLVFMKIEWNKDFSRKIEIKRECVKLEFSPVDKKGLSSNRLPFPGSDTLPSTN